jgi:hypothetical protein
MGGRGGLTCAFSLFPIFEFSVKEGEGRSAAPAEVRGGREAGCDYTPDDSRMRTLRVLQAERSKGDAVERAE